MRGVAKAQTVLFVLSALSAVTSLWTKAAIGRDPVLANYVDLPYFVHNFSHAANSARLYWASSAAFLLSLAIAGLLERAKTKPPR